MRRKLFLAFTCTLLVLHHATSQTPAPANSIANTSQTQTVTVPLKIYDQKGAPVSGLRPTDIRLTENKIPQTLLSVIPQPDTPLAFAILVDRSASQEKVLSKAKMIARLVLQSVVRSEKDKVAVVSLSDDARLEQPLSGDIVRANTVLEAIQTNKTQSPAAGSGNTALWDAIYATSDELLGQLPKDTRRAIVFISDGVDTASKYNLREAARRAAQSGVSVYAFGLGDVYYGGIDKDNLRKLTEQTGGRAFFPKNDNEIRAALGQIQQDLMTGYVASYQSNVTPRKDASEIRVEVTEPELRKTKPQLIYPRYRVR